jgi:hypothetical protein
VSNPNQTDDTSPGPQSGGFNIPCSEVPSFEADTAEFPPGTTFTSITVGVFPPAVTTNVIPGS